MERISISGFALANGLRSRLFSASRSRIGRAARAANTSRPPASPTPSARRRRRVQFPKVTPGTPSRGAASCWPTDPASLTGSTLSLSVYCRVGTDFSGRQLPSLQAINQMRAVREIEAWSRRRGSSAASGHAAGPASLAPTPRWGPTVRASERDAPHHPQQLHQAARAGSAVVMGKFRKKWSQCACINVTAPLAALSATCRASTPGCRWRKTACAGRRGTGISGAGA